MDAARRGFDQAEIAARNAYGTLLAILAARTRNIPAAEDALADAFAAALTQWPRDGVPARPISWLLTVARRHVGRAARQRRTADGSIEALALLQGARHDAAADGFGDERLKLLFVCTHPAIALEAQAPLMLQTVLGLDAARIAASFLVSAAAMGQQLVRAKRKIRDAGIAFVVPDPGSAASRIGPVLAAIYAAYGTAWEDVTGADPKLSGLAAEAIWLARLAAELLPDNAEATGLLSLMLHCEARRPARRSAAGDFMPLHGQDPGLWLRPMQAEAETLLHAAAARATPGRFQTEAAIQSLHVQQRLTGQRFTAALARLYDTLAAFAPTIGVLVARAVAIAEDGNPAAALGDLDRLAASATGYQPWWAARARVLWLAGDEGGAGEAARIAAGLSSDPSVRRFLLGGGYR